jgi:ribosome-associated translation inhibitor RaiA
MDPGVSGPLEKGAFMQQPLQIAFHGVEPSEGVETRIRERIAEIEEFCADIIRCRVVVELPHRHHQHGSMYRVSVDLKLPKDEIVVSREPGKNHAHEDVYVAIRDAFDATRRRVEDYVRRRREA